MNGDFQRELSRTDTSWITLSTPPPQGLSGGRRNRTALLIDNATLSREALAHVLRSAAPHLLVETLDWPGTRNLAHGSDRTAALGFDIVLLNIGADRLDDPEYQGRIAVLRMLLPESPLVVISDQTDGRLVIEALQNGLRGYFPSSLGADVLIAAIGLVLAGGTFIPQGVIAHCAPPADQMAATPIIAPIRAEPAGLTRREADVLSALRLGKPNKIIAYELSMSEGTVKVHVRNIMKKLSARNRTQLALLTQEPPPHPAA